MNFSLLLIVVDMKYNCKTKVVRHLVSTCAKCIYIDCVCNKQSFKLKSVNLL